MSGIWTGQWAGERFGLSLDDDCTAPTPLRELVGIALRRNPRRAHLLVSTVLGKHIPTAPQIVHERGLALGSRVGSLLEAGGHRPLVLGYAETATALGHCVAEQLRARYLHSTRRTVAGIEPITAFEETHSHATSHLLVPEDPALLRGTEPLVLVDDELSTGRTALNTIEGLHALSPRSHYVIASLVDVRDADQRARLDAAAARIGTRIDTVALGSGSIRWPEGFPEQAARFVAGRSPSSAPVAGPSSAGDRPIPVIDWPAQVRDGGRHGYTPADVAAARMAAATVSARICQRLAGERVLVLGFEELMYAPLQVALALPATVQVRFSSTTRSPVLPVDEPGYPIRTQLCFPCHDGQPDGSPERFAYNVAPSGGAAGYTDIVLVVDDLGDTAQLRAEHGLLDQLCRLCTRVHLVRIPSYRPAAVVSS